MTYEPTPEELREKLEEIISKHNDLVLVVNSLVESLEAINQVIFAQGESPKKFDS